MNEDVLRRVLEAEAARVEVSPDALPTIRRRIADRRHWRSRMRRLFAVGTAALATATATAAAVALGVVSCTPPAPVVPPPAATHPAPPSSVATPAPTASARPSPPPGPATSAPAPSATVGAPPAGPGTVASVAVYYQGSDRGRPRLYREFHRLPVGDGSARARVATAVREMLDGRTAYDPDYASAWPASAAVRGVRITGGIAIVDLSGAAVNGAGDAEAQLAVQQLVWTATAVTGVTGVQLRLDGAAVGQLWGRVDVSGTLRRAPAADVIGLVWLIAPQHGATVGRTFEVHVAGIVFEATAQLRVRQGTRIVAERVLTLSIGAPAQGETRLDLTLPPGTYVLEAYEISAADGSEQHLDDHTITVR
ncbi:MAG TPA: GerMN domain-containing protein [Micromonosporaceae bacterium]|nr:GerMN domain-containing protein [Micromonosporaceae bacterium]